MTRFTLPDLGEGLPDAEIVGWHVAEGDHVVADQPLVSVETAKAVVEIPSPQAGRIAHLLAKLGDRVEVGAPLVEFEEGAHADTGAVVGDLTPHPHHIAAPVVPMPSAKGAASKATPAIRALAKDRGVDLATLVGSGPEGTITRDDVERAAAADVPGREALRGVRLSMARNMAMAHQSVVPATLFDAATIEAWWNPTADVTIRLIRALAMACAAEPALNGWFDTPSLTRELKATIDLGIAVDTEAGLIVPVLRDVGRHDAASLRRSLDTLKAAVRMRTVAPSDLRGATISLSNFGTVAGRHASLVILPPQIAIIGAGRIELQAVPGPQGAAFRHVLPLSLTFDHRIVSGGEAARFMKAMIEDLSRAT